MPHVQDSQPSILTGIFLAVVVQEVSIVGPETGARIGCDLDTECILTEKAITELKYPIVI